MDDNTQKRIAQKLGELLAISPLNPDIKKVILANLDKIPGNLVFGLMESIERETDEVGRLALDIELFLNQQDKDWKNLEEDQKKLAGQIIEEETARIEEELKLDQVRQKIQQ